MQHEILSDHSFQQLWKIIKRKLLLV